MWEGRRQNTENRIKFWKHKIHLPPRQKVAQINAGGKYISICVYTYILVQWLLFLEALSNNINFQRTKLWTPDRRPGPSQNYGKPFCSGERNIVSLYKWREPARFLRKIVIFLRGQNHKSLWSKEIKFFRFLKNDEKNLRAFCESQRSSRNCKQRIAGGG